MLKMKYCVLLVRYIHTVTDRDSISPTVELPYFFPKPPFVVNK